MGLMMLVRRHASATIRSASPLSVLRAVRQATQSLVRKQGEHLRSTILLSALLPCTENTVTHHPAGRQSSRMVRTLLGSMFAFLTASTVDVPIHVYVCDWVRLWVPASRQL